MGITEEWLCMSGRIDKHEGHGVLKGKKRYAWGSMRFTYGKVVR